MISKKSGFVDSLLMFMGISFFVFLLISFIMQYATLPILIFNSMLGWDGLLGAACGVLFIIYSTMLTIKFAPLIIIFMCSSIYIDVHFYGRSLGWQILLCIWPTLFTIFYCIKNKRLSFSVSKSSAE